MATELQKHLRGTTRAAVEADEEIGEIGWNEATGDEGYELIIEDIAGSAHYHFPSRERMDDIGANVSGAIMIGVEDDSFTIITGDTDLQTCIKSIDDAFAALPALANVLLKDGSVQLTAAWNMGDQNVSINEASPDGKFCINIGTGTGKIITLKTDTSHSFTGIADDDTIGYLKEGTNSFGGLDVVGLNSGGSASGALRLTGYYNQADASSAIVQIVGAEWDSGTGAQAIGDADELFAIVNYTTEVITVKGDGSIATAGGIAFTEDLEAGDGFNDSGAARSSEDSILGAFHVYVSPSGSPGNDFFAFGDKIDGQVIMVTNDGSVNALIDQDETGGMDLCSGRTAVCRWDVGDDTWYYA